VRPSSGATPSAPSARSGKWDRGRKGPRGGRVRRVRYARRARMQIPRRRHKVARIDTCRRRETSFREREEAGAAILLSRRDREAERDAEQDPVEVGRRVSGGDEVFVVVGVVATRPRIDGGMVVVVMIEVGVVGGAGSRVGMAKRGRRTDIADQDEGRQQEPDRFRRPMTSHEPPISCEKQERY
jgi:hypothetical protein